jgi:hypothetical protein
MRGTATKWCRFTVIRSRGRRDDLGALRGKHFLNELLLDTCSIEDLRKVVTDPDLKKKIATRGSYTRAMSPAEARSLSCRRSNGSGNRC